jgi:membrane-anchored protein YejM (alkaline phosphatase superfamily)
MISISNVTIEENKTSNEEEIQYIDYKYNEGKALQEITDYVNKTYGEHYSQNKFQATEFIIDSGHGEGFCLGNMLKYTQRYGKKDTPTEWRKDLMKVIHYSIMMLHVHDLQHKTSK